MRAGQQRGNELTRQLRWQLHVRAGRMQVRQLPQQGLRVGLVVFWLRVRRQDRHLQVSYTCIVDPGF